VGGHRTPAVVVDRDVKRWFAHRARRAAW
jgi:hypothetical protein